MYLAFLPPETAERVVSVARSAIARTRRLSPSASRAA
jgi:hypothetical protein